MIYCQDLFFNMHNVGFTRASDEERVKNVNFLQWMGLRSADCADLKWYYFNFTNSRLAKIGYILCDLCTLCNASPETRDQLFYLCKYAKEFWGQFEDFWMSITKQNVSSQGYHCGRHWSKCVSTELPDSSWKIFYMELSKAKQFSKILFIHFAH